MIIAALLIAASPYQPDLPVPPHVEIQPPTYTQECESPQGNTSGAWCVYTPTPGGPQYIIDSQIACAEADRATAVQRGCYA